MDKSSGLCQSLRFVEFQSFSLEHTKEVFHDSIVIRIGSS